jgi:ribosomal protein L23
MVMKGKSHGGRRFRRRITFSPDWKKAVVTLAPDDHIELFEGV